jgi:Zn-dependent protease
MLQGVPAESPYDWNFRLMGFPVRVTWSFWLVAAAWGYEISRGWDRVFFQNGLDTPGTLGLLAIWIVALGISILIHELGHALTFRYFGMDAQVVLYYFGGLAIPGSFTSWRGARQPRLSSANQCWISAAGPAAQFGFGLLVVAIAIALKQTPGAYAMSWLQYWGWEERLELGRPANAFSFCLIEFLVYPSLVWAVLNLVPVLPLDGGRIVQHLIGIYGRGDGLHEATLISVIAGIGLGIFFFQSGNSFFGFLLLILGITNIQNLQMMGGRW